MEPRFYAPGFDDVTSRVCLPAEESVHLTRVLRLEAGAVVRVFNGDGLQRLGTVARVTKSTVDVDLGPILQAAPECAMPLVLAQAVLKADKFDAVVRDATMLGVSAVVPVLTEYGDVPAAAIRDGTRTARWQRIAVASAKQCGRAVVPRIAMPTPFQRLIAAERGALRLLLAEPILGVASVPLREAVASVPADGIVMAVGPEGGWAPEEIRLATETGWCFVSLGGRTLRADATPLVACAVVLAARGEL